MVDRAKLSDIKKMIDDRLEKMEYHLNHCDTLFEKEDPAGLTKFLETYEALLVPASDV